MRRSAPRRQGRRRKLTLDGVPGAVFAAYPGFIEPCLATPQDSVPKRGQWIHEIKHDGYRAQAHIGPVKSAIYTRRGYDWSERFGSIAQTLQAISARELILDGEVVVPDERGISNFHWLQDDLARGRTDRLVYFVFDVLYVDGFDLRKCPLIERKHILAQLMAGVAENARIRMNGHIEADAAAVLRPCAAAGADAVWHMRPRAHRAVSRQRWLVSCVSMFRPTPRREGHA